MPRDHFNIDRQDLLSRNPTISLTKLMSITPEKNSGHELQPRTPDNIINKHLIRSNGDNPTCWDKKWGCPKIKLQLQSKRSNLGIG